MSLLEDATAAVPGVVRVREARQRLADHLAAQPAASTARQMETPHQGEQRLATRVVDAALAGEPLPDIDQMTDDVLTIRDARRSAHQRGYQLMQGAVSALSRREREELRADVDTALGYLAGLLPPLLEQARGALDVLGDVRLDDDPEPPPAPDSFDLTVRTVGGGFTPVWQRPGRRIAWSQASQQQHDAWNQLVQLAGEYREIRLAQAQLVRENSYDWSPALRLAGEFADLNAVWPGWREHDPGSRTNAPPWGEAVESGAHAGADFLAWLAEQPDGTVWVPGLAEMKETADKVLNPGTEEESSSNGRYLNKSQVRLLRGLQSEHRDASGAIRTITFPS